MDPTFDGVLSGDPDRCDRQKDAPAFFRRLWIPNPRPGVITVPEFPLTIYGFSVESVLPEDQASLRDALARGGFQAFCFSEICPEGELGMVRVNAVEEFSREDFDHARAHGWPNTQPGE